MPISPTEHRYARCGGKQAQANPPARKTPCLCPAERQEEHERDARQDQRPRKKPPAVPDAPDQQFPPFDQPLHEQDVVELAAHHGRHERTSGPSLLN